MKKILLYLSAAVMLLAFASCEKDKAALKVSVKAGEAGSTYLTFTVASENADKVAWMCIESSQETPSAEKILADGTAAASGEQRADKLAPETEYIIIAAAAGGNATLLSTPVKMTTLKEGEGPGPVFDGYETKVVLEATYSESSASGLGNYFLALASAQPGADQNPKNIGDIIVMLDIYNVKDSDPVNAVLPDGTYNVVEGDLAAFTWYPMYSGMRLRVAEGEQGVQSGAFIAGNFTVESKGNDYIITAEMLPLNAEETIKFRYEGPITFVQTGSSESDEFTEDIIEDFEIAQATYWGNWTLPHSDDFKIEFFSGKFDNDGVLTQGYFMYLPMFMDKLPEPNSQTVVKIQEGTYTPRNYEKYSAPYLYQIPMTITGGYWGEVLGQTYPFGAYITHTDANGNQKLGFIVGGEMKVAASGDGYAIDYDLEMDNGYRIKGSYNKKVNMLNRCDNSNMLEKPWSNLQADEVLEFDANTVAVAYYYGDDYLMPELDSWTLYIMPKDENPDGDIVMMDFLTAKGGLDKIPDGTYNVSNKYGANVIIPGYMGMGGALLYTWCGHNVGDESISGPAVEGTMTVAQSGSNYTFTFDFVDDSGKKMAGTYTGAVEIIDYFTNASAPARVPFAR